MPGGQHPFLSLSSWARTETKTKKAKEERAQDSRTRVIFQEYQFCCRSGEVVVIAENRGGGLAAAGLGLLRYCVHIGQAHKCQCIEWRLIGTKLSSVDSRQ
jgi:hypothetical protein